MVQASKENWVKIPEPGCGGGRQHEVVYKCQRGLQEELSFMLNSLPALKMPQPEEGSSNWKSAARESSRLTASGRWSNVGKGSRQNGAITSGKGLALRVGHEGPSSKPIDCQQTA
ncbi:hypothetical protein AXF42_Ash021069 [Apostasia shenzhenica]|uniref:Uncharacterized protein n=1 Tax=Apostasia shenzhenica TaxID=1088818 RepID=A0A2I0A4J0_9ASPA|nr:hypothetical protein AXF42_Ash021069 [Apostasia shenzhenica]